MVQDQFLDPPRPDLIEQWTHYVRLLDARLGDQVLDVGCGSGDAEDLLARLVPGLRRVVGLDSSTTRLARTAALRVRQPRVTFLHGDGRTLPFPDGTFDRVLCADMLEWARPPVAVVRELRRVLRPGGRAMLIHTDFDTQVFGGVDALLSREIVHAFNDAGPDGTTGRRLLGLAREAGFSRVQPHVYTLVNDTLAPDRYSGHAVAMIKEWLAAKQVVPAERLAAWVREVEATQAAGQFFYSVNRDICICWDE